MRIADSRSATLPAARNPSLLNELHAATLKATLATDVCGLLKCAVRRCRNRQADGPARRVLLLSFEARLAPDASKLQRAHRGLLHESRDIADRLAAAQREGPLLVCRVPGALV